MNSNGDRLAVDLLPGNALDVDDIFETVYRDNLSLTALERSTGDDDLVILADGDRTDVVLLSQLLRERCRHYNSADGRGGAKVCLSGLSPGRGDAGIEFGHFGSGEGSFYFQLKTLTRFSSTN